MQKNSRNIRGDVNAQMTSKGDNDARDLYEYDTQNEQSTDKRASSRQHVNTRDALQGRTAAAKRETQNTRSTLLGHDAKKRGGALNPQNRPVPLETDISGERKIKRSKHVGTHQTKAANNLNVSSGYGTISNTRRYAPASAIAAKKKRHVWPFILIGVLVVIIGVVIYAFANSGYKSPYTWSNMKWDENGRPSYVVNGEVQSKFGIDVSAHNLEIDWNAVKNDGVEFVYIRLGWRGYSEGGLHTDDYYTQYLAGAKSVGLPIGVYFFSQATTKYEAQQEAEYLLEVLGNTKLDLPIVFDHERVDDSLGRANDLDHVTATGIAERFCSTIEAAGYQTMVYGNQKDMARFDASVTENRAVWLAQYTDGYPTAQFDFCIWQYSDTGQIDGISTNVDMDIWFTDVLPLEKYVQNEKNA